MHSKFDVWAHLYLSRKSTREVHDFFRKEYSISAEFMIPDLHLTIYHARRPMFDLDEMEKSCFHVVDTMETRFMVLVPGGENPIENIHPAHRKVGIRIKKDSELRSKIDEYRNSLLIHETPKILGNRKPSSRSRNAFGARHFQPHISILKAGSGIINDLNEVGENFRDVVPELTFDKFRVIKRSR